MSRGSCPFLLTMALAAPGASHALGLGEIHVDSRLNQPLSAHIDLIGASDAELASLDAAIGNLDAYRRAGLDRPVFLNSAKFSITHDHGHPVLTLRSDTSFTEPVVDVVIELHWSNGALIRQYTILLDPVGAANGSALDVVSSESASAVVPAPTIAPSASQYRVRPHDTLHGVAHQLGARSKADARRMMMTLFRHNPHSFDANINRLHRGTVLQLPTAEQLAEGSDATIAREFRAQMTEWRLAGRPEHIPVAVAPAPAVGIAKTTIPQQQSAEELKQRISSLQASLFEVRQQIAEGDAQIQELRRQAQNRTAESKAPRPFPTASAAPASHKVETRPTSASLRPGIAGPALAALALVALAFWRLRRIRTRSGTAGRTAGVDDRPEPYSAQTMPAPASVAASFERNPEPPAATTTRPAARPISGIARDLEETIVIESTLEGDESSLEDSMVEAEDDPTVKLKQDANLAELERSAQHVLIGNELGLGTHGAPFVERRRSVVDVLRAAIDKEPHRHELKIKLLEMYYAAALANQASFLEVAKMMARDRDMLASGEWEQVMAMGRMILPGERLFLVDSAATADMPALSESAA